MIFYLAYYVVVCLNFFMCFGLLSLNSHKYSVFSYQLIVVWLTVISMRSLHNNLCWLDMTENVHYYIVIFVAFNVIWVQLLDSGNPSFEIIIFLMLILVSTIVLVLSNDVVIWFIAFEVISLGSYALISIEKNSIKNIEASLKYFTVGSLVSAFYLIGITLLFGMTNSFNFSVLSYFNWSELHVLILILIIFNIGLAPFHEWMCDVVAGSSLTIASLLSTVINLALLFWFMQWVGRLQFELASPMLAVLLLVCLLSWYVGYVGSLNQSMLARFLAYSSVANMGWIMVAIVLGQTSVQYLLVYIATVMLLFSIGLSLKISTNHTNNVLYLIDLGGLHIYSVGLAVSLTIGMFSAIGIPPLGGFWVKYNILYALVNFDYFLTSLLAVLASLIGSFAYLSVLSICTHLTSSYCANNMVFVLVNRVELSNPKVSVIISVMTWLLTTYVCVSSGLTLLLM